MENGEKPSGFPSWVWGLGIVLLLLVIILYQLMTSGNDVGNLFSKETTIQEENIADVEDESPAEVPPSPGKGESYYEFRVGDGVFSVILPEGVSPSKLDVAPDEGFSVDLGDDRVLTIYFANEPAPPGDDCSDYTEAMLGETGRTSDYYRLDHKSGAQSCVLDSLIDGNYIFEVALFVNGNVYELHTVSDAAPSAYVPRGYLTLGEEEFIFSDGFETGDTSAWSR